MEEKCPNSFTVFDKEGIPITVTLYELCTFLRVGENGVVQDRNRPMATKLNVSLATIKELIKKVWGAKSMPSLPVVKNIQDGSAGFGDETLNGFGWADAKARGVGLLAFFCTLSQEQRKVLEDENKKGRWSLNPKTKEKELVSVATENMRQPVEHEDPLTGATETIRRGAASMRQLVPFQNQLIRRSAKNNIIKREKKGNWCPCGDKCPSCDIQTSIFWITLPKAKDYFVHIGDDCGYELADEDVVDYWCKIAPKLSKEMFRANGANERAVCKYCFQFAIKSFSEQLGATTIFVPR